MNLGIKNRFIALFLIFGVLSSFLRTETLASCWKRCPSIEAPAAAVIDVETGTLLVEKNAEKKRYPASITKVMTALLTLNHMKSMDEKIVFNKKAVTAEELESKTLWLAEGEVLSMKDCLHGLLLASANDIAKGLAFHVGGSLEGFASMMNEKAKELGCVNTHFTNPHGLFEEEHYTCAADMVKIMAACAKNPRFMEIAGTLRYTIPKTNKFQYRRFLLNDSKMLNKKSPYYYPKCAAAKTGYVEESKKTYIAIAKNGKQTLAGVIMGINTLEAQYRGLESLFEYCFKNFSLVDADEFSVEFPIKFGNLYSKVLRKDREARFKMDKKVKILLPNDYKKEAVHIQVNYEKPSLIKVGINKMGHILYSYEGREVGRRNFYYGSYNEYRLQ